VEPGVAGPERLLVGAPIRGGRLEESFCLAVPAPAHEAVAEIAMQDPTTIEVKRVVVALDCGYVCHRDAVVAQIEGGVIWGLSALMHEEITIKDGRVEQTNFGDYPLLRLAEAPPKIEAVLVPTGGFWGGVGEPPIGPVLPAMCNAIFAATGKRIRSLPLKHHGFSYA
jgi:isoquinoline 1-oxidoreductase beta subunit